MGNGAGARVCLLVGSIFGNVLCVVLLFVRFYLCECCVSADRLMRVCVYSPVVRVPRDGMSSSSLSLQCGEVPLHM